MLVVDADTHIDETEATWEYLAEGEQQFRPLAMDAPGQRGLVEGDARPHRLWLIDGQLRVRRFRNDQRTGTTLATRELVNIDERMSRMDEIGVDIQVIYPTLMLSALTPRPDVELALCRSYNRWMADRTAASQGRLRWVAILPLLSIDEAVKELRYAVDHGACGLYKRALDCGGRGVGDPYFFPLYEEVSRLNVPICFHTGDTFGGNPALTEFSSSFSGAVSLGNLLTISAFINLVLNNVPSQFPNLRFGWIEASASWVPYLVHDLEAKQKRMNSLKFEFARELFGQGRFYVTCDTMDDLSYILPYGVEDCLILGSDYGHQDQSAELEAHRILRSRAEQGDITMEVADKILSDNARRFYNL
ncbi:MAG: hypothetical protein C1O27_001308 [Chloroflexi bacterium]|jgi:hypothetical protein|nr:MAG: hypothetical protein C1O27_001308 [Chloroflexota bacterium]